jgi:hypothetical protein
MHTCTKQPVRLPPVTARGPCEMHPQPPQGRTRDALQVLQLHAAVQHLPRRMLLLRQQAASHQTPDMKWQQQEVEGWCVVYVAISVCHLNAMCYLCGHLSVPDLHSKMRCWTYAHPSYACALQSHAHHASGLRASCIRLKAGLHYRNNTAKSGGITLMDTSQIR